MRYGVQLPNYGLIQGRESFIRVCRAAEDLGYDSVWVSDHVVIPVEGEATHPSGNPQYAPRRLAGFADPLISLAVAAGCTERITLGTAVLVLPLRNPLLTAKMLASLDVLSGGRVVLGAGAGWLEAEFEAVAAPPFSQRGAVVEEWIEIFRTCWSEDRISFEGAHYSFDEVDFRPRPQRPIPVLLGGTAPAALRRAGRIGDGWFGSSQAVPDVARCIREVRAHAESAGRDPDALSFGCGYTAEITASAVEPSVALVGTTAHIAERIAALGDAGIDFLDLRLAPIIGLDDPSIDRAVEMMQEFAEVVVPAVG